MPPANPLPRIASRAKTTLELLLITSAVADRGFNCTVPPVIVSAPAKLGERPSVCVAMAALFAITAVPVVFATVKVVVELIALIYQPNPAVSPVPLIG